MTAYRFVTLTCDVCGEIHDDGISLAVRDARASARSEGWRYTRALGDVCPAHRGYHRDGIGGWTRNREASA